MAAVGSGAAVVVDRASLGGYTLTEGGEVGGVGETRSAGAP